MYDTDDDDDQEEEQQPDSLEVDYAVDEPAKDRIRVRIRVDDLRSRKRVSFARIAPQIVREASNAII
ncbi:unnamed protein product, partial [Echinostoma caproni]|uniref:Kinesin motor domain-containing protein n=1 Tax=Echinostoma caproni TaxID=27848 RepID=A0A183BBP3_9TREM